jgi:hypothetical protein
MPTFRSQSGRKAPVLTYRQRQLAKQVAQSNRDAINADIDQVLSYIDEQAKRLSKKYKRAVPWFLHQFYQGGRVARTRRRVNLFNAAQQVDAFLDGRKGGKCYLLFCVIMMSN